MQTWKTDVKMNTMTAVEQLIAKNKANSFIKSIKTTPAHSITLLHELLVMVKQLNIPTFFSN